jgi:hypothetical protein
MTNQQTTKTERPLRETKSLSFNPKIYKSYKQFIESKDKIISRDIERHMIRTLNNA